eukprot:TRINITY_DN65362_c0_g1_i2.p1 TRINITY_DN65362_c0_g1~~TRINITY_DN65362_c0_g1_i2.p1  ORF type:complete len:216 (-),score=56.14 TRINITY_DN65362_c0_g1_i2:125-703(-)
MTKDNHCLGTFDLSGIPPAPRGVPQIQVSFEVDANGILNVSAEDKGSGNKKAITITNDKGRLSKEEIEKMVADGKRFEEDDRRQKERIDARNEFENYAFSMKNTVNEASSSLSSEDKEKVVQSAQDAISWLDSNHEASTEEYKGRMSELQSVCNPIIQKMYQQGGGGGASSFGGAQQQSGTTSDGPKVEEVD